MLLGQCLLQLLLDGQRVLDEYEVGHTLVDLESRPAIQFPLVQLTPPLHVVSHATVVVVAVEGCQCHSL